LGAAIFVGFSMNTLSFQLVVPVLDTAAQSEGCDPN
jgi:hypothetical protein